MRTVTVTAGETIQLGYQYDNEATQVVFPDTIVEAITDVYGTTGTFAIWYRRSGDALGYPIGYPLITYADGQVTWTLTEADMANPGSSQIQLRYIVDEVCVMSQMFMGNVSDSVDIGTDIPAPMQAWADALISAAVSGITDDIKDALLDCFAHVAWIDDQGQTYYDALEDALYPPVPVSSVTVTPSTFQLSSIGGTQQLTATILPSSAQATVSWSSSDTSVATVSESGLVTSVAVGTATITATADGVTGTAACTVALPTLSSISAVYTQSGTVYTTDSLDSLKSDLVVTATYSDSSTATIPSTDYTLSGTLTVGTSTVTVSYGGKTATFTVTVTHMTNGLVDGTYSDGTAWSHTVTNGNVISSVTSGSNGHTVNIPFRQPIQLYSGDVVKFASVRDGGASLNTGLSIGLNGNVYSDGGAFCPYRATTLAKTITLGEDLLAESFTISSGSNGRSFTLVLTVNGEDVFV